MTKSLSGGQAAVEALKAEDTKHVFGLIGSATMELFDALYDETSINFIGVHDERTGCHMADGYARASGNAGVVLAGQNGPGRNKSCYRPVSGDGCIFANRFNLRCTIDGAYLP